MKKEEEEEEEEEEDRAQRTLINTNETNICMS